MDSHKCKQLLRCIHGQDGLQEFQYNDTTSGPPWQWVRPLGTSAGLPLTLQRAPVRLCWRGVFDTSADWLSVVKSPKPPQQVAASCWRHLKATHCVLSCCCKIASAVMIQDHRGKRDRSGAENNWITGGDFSASFSTKGQRSKLNAVWC